MSSQNKVPIFLKRKTQKFTREMLYPTSPKIDKTVNEFASFRYLSPKAKNGNLNGQAFNFAQAIKTTNEGQIILLNQENQKLKKQLEKLKKQKINVDEQNSFLRSTLQAYSYQLSTLKSSGFCSPQNQSRLQIQQLSTVQFTCINCDGISAINDDKVDRNDTSVYLDQSNAMLLQNSRALTSQNELLQESLIIANSKISKMKKQLQTAQISLRILQRKLHTKQKQLKLQKAKNIQMRDRKNIFDLSDDQ